jgi:transcriptional regulator with XRE-family HTH domain
MKLNQTLKMLLNQRGLTIREVASKIKISESTLKTWMRGSNPRSMDDVRTCAQFFNVSLEFLLFGEESNLPRSVEEMPLESVFNGWLKVRIDRAIPIKKAKDTK